VDLEGAEVLDLFSGSGMVSLEFASRGAASVTSIEREPKAVKHLDAAFEQFDCTNCRALRGDVWQFINRPITSFDIVFADPPYAMDRLQELPSIILAGSLLQPEGLLILEHGERTHFEDERGFIERRNYGQVHFSFFRHPEVS
jgi:16S rRNA (guanine(966)-N(2))-methyltransferase RsmD